MRDDSSRADDATLPPRLQRGDTVLVTSVSSPLPSGDHLARIDVCLESMGLHVVHGEHVLARKGYLAGSAPMRADDLNRGLADDDIRAIFFAWGGKGANQLLPLIDYAIFREHPKIVLGLSDPAVIVNALHARSGVITFHGPTGVNFSDPAGLAPYTKESLTRTLFDSRPVGALPPHSTWESLRTGTATGRLVGGHLSTIQTLLGTSFEPAWDERIFFWEEVGRTPRQIDHILTHFRLRGVFDKIAGMVVGRPLSCDDPETDASIDIRSMILSVCDSFAFPILFNVDLGHADPKLTLPIGALAELEVRHDGTSFAIAEGGVG